MDWTPEQIAAGAAAIRATECTCSDVRPTSMFGFICSVCDARAALSAVDLSDHDRAVAADALRQAAAFWDSLTPEAADELFFDVADWLRVRAEGCQT